MGNRAMLCGLMTIGLIAPSLVIACSRGLSKEEVDRLVDNRLAERGFPQPGTSASASATPVSSASRPTEDPNPQVAASMSFLRQIDELMKGYQPELPQLVDSMDNMRCISSYVAQTEPRLKGIASKAAADRKASLAAIEKTKREFRDKVRPLNFRMDYDWKTRGAKSPAVYGCWIFTPSQANWATRGNESADDCSAWAAALDRGGHYISVGSEWKVKLPEGSFIYTYSQSKDPPNDPPELMRRAGTANLTPPARFACRVADVLPTGERVVVRCEVTGSAATSWLSPEGLDRGQEHDGVRTARAHRSAQLGRHRRWSAPAPSSPTTPDVDPDSAMAIASRYPPVIRLTRGIPQVNIGDVVSVPFGDTKRDPDGLLLLWNPTAPKGNAVWTIDADGAALKVEQAAKCPSIDDIVSATDAGRD